MASLVMPPNYRKNWNIIIDSSAMSLRIPYLRKGAKNAAKEELLSPPERHKKTKKHQALPVGATLTTQHTARSF